MRIMWIDDEPDNLQYFQENLLGRGYECEHYANNDDALEALRRGYPFDLIIQDIMRPPGSCLASDHVSARGSGIAFYEKYIRSLRPNTPVLFFSAVVSIDLVHKIEDFPNCKMLSKPARAENILNLIDQIFAEEAEKIYDFEAPKESSFQLVRIDFSTVNRELLAYLAKHPNSVHDLSPRKFEELIASIFSDLGYEVVLTPKTRDGGVDIYAIQRDNVGELLYVIECKKYSPSRSVGVEQIRSLYGVKNAKGASAAILVTTSFFTEPAKTFQKSLKYEVSLRDYDNVKNWLRKYNKN